MAKRQKTAISRRRFNPVMHLLAQVLVENAAHADELLYDDETDTHYVLFINIRPEDWAELFERAGLAHRYDESKHPGSAVSVILTEDTDGFRYLDFYTTIEGALDAWNELKSDLG